MKTDQFGQMIFSESDVVDLYMQGADMATIAPKMLVDHSVDLESAALILENVPKFLSYDAVANSNISVQEFDHRNQCRWNMPDSYHSTDIAEYVLSLCASDAELQRCGQELMLYQERGLFNLLRYLKYLVDVMTQERLIWGVGRGSSVASYVLYKIGVHRIDSLHYDLDIAEFLR